MQIQEIDRNFQIQTSFAQEDLQWFDGNCPPFTVVGVEYHVESGCYLRLPQEKAAAVSAEVETLNQCTSGGRVYFQTDSTVIAIEAQMILDEPMAHMTYSCQAGFDLYGKDGQRWRYINTFIPQVGMQEGYASLLQTSGSCKDYMIYFPLYSGVRQLRIGVQKGALLGPSQALPTALPVVFYGSSITQGGCASRPGICYPAMVSRRMDMDFRNMGFSGACLGEQSMMETLSQIPMGAFVYDYDHNAPDADHLRHTHWQGYQTIRAVHPEIPIILLTAPDSLQDNATFAYRRMIIQETFEKAKRMGDKNISYVRGDTFFPNEERDSCTVDTRHPNDLGFYWMAGKVESALTDLIQRKYSHKTE